MVDGLVEESSYSFIFPKNNKGEKLCKGFSEYVSDIRADGELSELDEKWFGERMDNKKSEDLPSAEDDSKESQKDSQKESQKDSQKETQSEKQIETQNETQNATGTDAKKASGTDADKATGTDAEDKDAKVIHLALCDDESIPFAYMSAGKPVGYDIDIIIGFCKENGYTVTVDMTDFAEMQEGVASGKYDLGCGGITVTDERKETMLFCESVYYGGVAICTLDPNADSVVNAPGSFMTNRRNIREGKIARFIRHFKNTFIEGERYKLFAHGILVTLIVSLSSVILGSMLGFLLFRGSRRGSIPTKLFCNLLLWLIQGVPAVMIILSLYYSFYRNMHTGSMLASITGFTFVFAGMCDRNIEKNGRRFGKGRLIKRYRLEYFGDKKFLGLLFRRAGRYVLEDYRDDIITIIKVSAVVGYVSAWDMVKTFDLIRIQRTETIIPMLATTIVYMIIIKLITKIITVISRKFGAS